MKENEWKKYGALMLIGAQIIILIHLLLNANGNLFEENGWFENSQAVTYLGAFALGASVLFRPSGFERWLAGFLSLTYLAFFLREVDLTEFHPSAILDFLAAGTSKDVLVTCLFVGLFIRLFSKYANYLTHIRSIMKCPVTLLSLAGCLLLVAGHVFELADLRSAEEFIELDGSLLILLGATAFRSDPFQLERKIRKVE